MIVRLHIFVRSSQAGCQQYTSCSIMSRLIADGRFGLCVFSVEERFCLFNIMKSLQFSPIRNNAKPIADKDLQLINVRRMAACFVGYAYQRGKVNRMIVSRDSAKCMAIARKRRNSLFSSRIIGDGRRILFIHNSAHSKGVLLFLI